MILLGLLFEPGAIWLVEMVLFEDAFSAWRTSLHISFLHRRLDLSRQGCPRKLKGSPVPS